jgi:hypothetical protein
MIQGLQVARQCTVTILFSLEVEVSFLIPIFISLDKFLPPGLVLWTVATLVESYVTIMIQYALTTAWDSILKMAKENIDVLGEDSTLMRR